MQRDKNARDKVWREEGRWSREEGWWESGRSCGKDQSFYLAHANLCLSLFLSLSPLPHTSRLPLPSPPCLSPSPCSSPSLLQGVVGHVQDQFGYIECCSRDLQAVFHVCEVMDQNRAIQQGDEVEYTPVLSKDKVCVCVREGVGGCSECSVCVCVCHLQNGYVSCNSRLAMIQVTEVHFRYVHTYVHTYIVCFFTDMLKFACKG